MEPGRTALPVSGDDPAAKNVALELADQLASTASMPDRLLNPGASNPALPSTPPTCPSTQPGGP